MPGDWSTSETGTFASGTFANRDFSSGIAIVDLATDSSSSCSSYNAADNTCSDVPTAAPTTDASYSTEAEESTAPWAPTSTGAEESSTGAEESTEEEASTEEAGDAPTAAEVNATVLVIGGGMAGTAAVQSLLAHGITDFVLIEARDMLGGRMQSEEVAGIGTLEKGANWIHGAYEENPAWQLVERYNMSYVMSDYENYLFFNMTSGDAEYEYETLPWMELEHAIENATHQLRAQDLYHRSAKQASRPAPRRSSGFARVASFAF